MMRRIVKPAEPEAAPESAETIEVSTPAGASAGKRKRRERLNLVKLTLEIERQLDFRLAGVASSRGMRKHALIIKLLDQGLGNFKIDESLKTVWRESQGQNVSAA